MRKSNFEPIGAGFEAPCEDRRSVLCNACNRVGIPDENWRCACGVKCRFGHSPAICPTCGKTCIELRVGHRAGRIVCDACALTPERRRQRAKEAAAALVAQQERDDKRRHSADATECWDDKGQQCSVTPAKPTFAYCYACPKFGGRRVNTPQVRTSSPTHDRGFTPPMQKIETEEYDIEDVG